MRPTQEELEERNILKSKLSNELFFEKQSFLLDQLKSNIDVSTHKRDTHEISPMFLEIFNFLERAIKIPGI